MKSKLAKIKTMAERGTTHEREVAKRMLDDLLEKYDLTLDDIQDREERLYWIVYKRPYEKDLIFQIVAHVLKTSTISWTKKKASKRVGLRLTPAQYATIRDFWETYRQPLVDEIEKYLANVFSAFVQKHRLFNPDATGGSAKDDLDPDLIAALIRNMTTIQKPHRQISS